MSTVIRNSVSYRSPYFISKERFLELKHFCLQYDDYKRRIVENSVLRPKFERFETSGRSDGVDDKTADLGVYLTILGHYMEMIEECSKKAGGDISGFIFEAVTKGKSYATLNPPCSKNYFYQRYRAFFWMLDKER